MSAAILYCSFCGKSQHEVTELLAGANVNICNECVVMCTETIADMRSKRGDETKRLWAYLGVEFA